MRSKERAVLAAMLLALTCTACGMEYPALPEQPEVFALGTFTDEDSTQYGTLDYAGRRYMPYGTLCASLHEEDVDACIGYVVQEDADGTDVRLYTLSADPAHNFLMEQIPGSSLMDTPLMDTPIFWRAVDTRGKNVQEPDFVEGLEYAFWEE